MGETVAFLKGVPTAALEVVEFCIADKEAFGFYFWIREMEKL